MAGQKVAIECYLERLDIISIKLNMILLTRIEQWPGAKGTHNLNVLKDINNYSFKPRNMFLKCVFDYVSIVFNDF